MKVQCDDTLQLAYQHWYLKIGLYQKTIVMLQKLPIMVYSIAPILCLLCLTLCYSKITYAINNIQLKTPFFYVQSSLVYKSPVTLTYSI